MTDEERAAARAIYARADPYERLEKMMTEIANGVPRHESIALIDADDGAAWDVLARQIAEMKADGITVSYDLEAPTAPNTT